MMLWRTRTVPASGVKRRRSQTVASRDVVYESWFSQGRCVCFRRSLVTALGPVADIAFAARRAHSQGPEAVVKFDKRLAGTVGRLSSGVRRFRRCQRRMADIALSRERTLQRRAKAHLPRRRQGIEPQTPPSRQGSQVRTLYHPPALFPSEIAVQAPLREYPKNRLYGTRTEIPAGYLEQPRCG